MNKKSVIKLFAMLLAAAVMLSAFPAAFASEEDVITLKNNEMSASVSSAYGGSLLVSGDVNITEGARVYIKLFDESGAELANVPVQEALAAGEYKSFQLLIHKNRAKYKLYQSGTLVKEGEIANGVGKTAAKASVIAENGEALIKNLKISDYMNTSDKTKTLFESDFLANDWAAVGTSKLHDNYCDDWYMGMPYAGEEGGFSYFLDENGKKGLYYSRRGNDGGFKCLIYQDQTGKQSLRHMIKPDGEDKNFEITTSLHLSHYNNKYDGGLRIFITDQNGNVINLIKGTAEIGDADGNGRADVGITDYTGRELFKIKSQMLTDIKIKVDLDAQLYTVSYKKSSESAYAVTSEPIALPNMVSAAPYAITKAYAVGFAKDVKSAGGSIYIQNVSVKEDADPAVTMLFEDDFNDGKTTGWSFMHRDYSPVNLKVADFKGHKALLVERNNAKSIEDAATVRTSGVTHYGSFDESGNFVQDTSGSKYIPGTTNPTWASNAAVWYVKLDNPIDKTQNVFVEYDLHMGNKSWKFNGTGYDGPRDVAYASLGSYASNAIGGEYMEFGYSGGAIQQSSNKNQTGKIIPSAENSWYNWKNDGPCAEWITSKIENRRNQIIFYETKSNSKTDKTVFNAPQTDKEVSCLSFTVDNNHGGAVYIDNIKIYTKDDSIKETVDFAAQTTGEIPVSFAEREKSLTVNKIEGLSECTPITSVTVNNYSGEVGQSVLIVAALYDITGENKMLAESAAEKAVLDKVGEKEIEFSSSFVLPNDYSAEKYNLTLFMFDSETLKPLIGAVSCTEAE